MPCFRRWSSSSGSGAWSAPRSAAARETAAPARSWPVGPKMGPFAIGRSSRAFSPLSARWDARRHDRGPRSRQGLSPIQQAMVEHHGSQCGFCTPGFVTSLTGLFECGRTDRRRVNPRKSRRQSLPVHGLCADPRGGLVRRPCTGPAAARASIPRGQWSRNWRRALVDPLLIETGRRIFFRPIESRRSRRVSRRSIRARSSRPAAPSWASSANKRGLEPTVS